MLTRNQSRDARIQYVQRRRAEGAPWVTIADELNVDADGLRQWLRAAGVREPRPCGQRHFDVLAFVQRYQKKTGGITPSYSEIAKGIGAASKAHISCFISDLAAAGHIRRLRDRARAIEIVHDPNRIPIYDADTLQIRGFIS